MIPSEQMCDLCGVVDFSVRYCGFCKKWLCDNCRRDPVKRVKGMVKDKILRRKNLY
jgi:hypothetical protein